MTFFLNKIRIKIKLKVQIPMIKIKLMLISFRSNKNLIKISYILTLNF